MIDAEASRGIAATIAIARDLDLRADDAVVVHSSNKLGLRLVPCDAFARVCRVGEEVAALEIEVAQRLTEVGSPVAALDPRVAPRTYERDGFVVWFWTYYEPMAPRVEAADYARALEQLHAGMRGIDVTTPHFTDRVADPSGAIDSTPLLDGDDRDLLTAMLRDLERAVVERGAPEQLLHGEPHPGNVLSTAIGPVFVDLETCCRGPVEFDLAHGLAAAGDLYPGIDRALLEDCRGLILAMVAKHRCDPGDELPNRERALRELVAALRAGPPWPTLEEIFARVNQ